MKRWILLGCVVVAIVAGISGVAYVRRADEESSWKELRSVEDLRKRFNQDEGSIRIILLLSPT
jgi:hypothetical protein